MGGQLRMFVSLALLGASLADISNHRRVQNVIAVVHVHLDNRVHCLEAPANRRDSVLAIHSSDTS